MSIPVANVYYLLCYAWGHADQADLVDRGTLDRLERVEDLLAKALAEGTFRLVRRGVGRDYREVTREIAGVRGKLQVAAMATRAVRARGRTLSTFEERSADVLHNRILRSTLGALRRRESLQPAIRRDVALAHQKLEGIAEIPLRRRLFGRVQLDRNQRHYRFLLEVCGLLHDLLLVDERGAGSVRFHDFDRDQHAMWRLFEDFAREFYRTEQDGLRVLRRRKVQWHGLVGRTPRDEGFVPRMAADLLLESPARRIILDTKFYGRPLSRKLHKLDPTHLYQLLAYLENRQGSLPDGPRHEGILLYAAVERSFRVDLTVRGFRLQARTVDLSRPWQEIHDEMLEVLG